MKKRILSLILTAVCFAMLGGCGKQSENNQTNEVNILKEMEAVNETDALVSRYGRAAYRHTDYYADDTVENMYFYKDQERYVAESDYSVMIDEAGDVYGFYNGEAKAFHSLFVGDSYEAFHNQWNFLVGYRYDGEKETVLSQVTENGVIDIDTEITDDGIVNENIVSLNYEEGSVKKLLYCYEVEEETYVINKMTTTAVLADGTEKVLSEAVRVADAEVYVPDEQLTKTVFEGDMRTLTVTVDAGTDAEKVYTQTISKGNILELMLPESYEQAGYLDADYTTKYTGEPDLEADLHIYVRSQSK